MDRKEDDRQADRQTHRRMGGTEIHDKDRTRDIVERKREERR